MILRLGEKEERSHLTPGFIFCLKEQIYIHTHDRKGCGHMQILNLAALHAGNF